MSICVGVTVKIQFDNTKLVSTPSYSPSTRSLCALARFGPPIQKFWIGP